MGTQTPPKGHSPQFSAHVCCNQTAGWMKIPFGTEVGNIVLNGDSAPLERGTAPPLFGPCLLWRNGWMDQDATWHEGRPQPWQLCVRWGPSASPHKGVEPHRQFSAHFYCGQTAECIKMPLGMEIGLSPREFVLDGDPAPFPKRRRSPQFLAMSLAAKLLQSLHVSRWNLACCLLYTSDAADE